MAMPRPCAPPALPEEAEEEILLCSPADDPARLVRAALVCKRWRRLVTGPAFRRRFRDRHHPAPMLGFLVNDVPSTRFVRAAAGTRSTPAPAASSCAAPPCAPHGHASPSGTRSPQAAATGTCRSHGCRTTRAAGTPRYSVTTTTTPKTTGPSASSSWSEPAYYAAPQAQHHGRVDAARGALAGNALYFVLHSIGARLLRYDLGTRELSVLDLPPSPAPASHDNNEYQRVVLTTTEDGGLGLARMEGHSRLCLWWSVPVEGEVVVPEQLEWAWGSEVELSTLLPGSPPSICSGSPMALASCWWARLMASSPSTRSLAGSTGLETAALVPYVSFYIPLSGTITN